MAIVFHVATAHHHSATAIETFWYNAHSTQQDWKISICLQLLCPKCEPLTHPIGMATSKSIIWQRCKKAVACGDSPPWSIIVWTLYCIIGYKVSTSLALIFSLPAFLWESTFVGVNKEDKEHTFFVQQQAKTTRHNSFAWQPSIECLQCVNAPRQGTSQCWGIHLMPYHA